MQVRQEWQDGNEAKTRRGADRRPGEYASKFNNM